MIEHLYTVSAAGSDPRANLAAESALMDEAEKNALILYLWQNDNTIVIGRNQNFYRECSRKNTERDHVNIVRRPSGGGAVYHDMGNLNFTFITGEENYSVERQSLVILRALAMVGLKAEISGRNDLLIDGHKFSGNAYYHHEGFAYQHGTLLIHSDLSKMPLYLNPDPLKLKANSVSSVKSRVTNLCAYKEDLGIEEMKELLFKAAEEEYGLVREEIALPYDETWRRYYDLYSSDEWIYGKNPPFDAHLETRFAWGGAEMRFHVEKGIITACTIYSDSMEPDEIDTIAKLMEGIPFTKQAILEQLETEETGMRHDLREWIAQQEI